MKIHFVLAIIKFLNLIMARKLKFLIIKSLFSQIIQVVDLVEQILVMKLVYCFLDSYFSFIELVINYWIS